MRTGLRRLFGGERKWWDVRAQDGILILYILVFQRILLTALVVLSITRAEFAPERLWGHPMDNLVVGIAITGWLRVGVSLMALWFIVNIVTAWRERPYGIIKSVGIAGATAWLLYSCILNTLAFTAP